MQTIAFQQSSPQAVIALAQPWNSEQLHSAQAVGSARCGVHIGTAGGICPGGFIVCGGRLGGVGPPGVIGIT